MVVFVANPYHVTVFTIDFGAISRKFCIIVFTNTEKLHLKLVAKTGFFSVFNPIIKGSIQAHRTTDFDFWCFVSPGVKKPCGAIELVCISTDRIETKQ